MGNFYINFEGDGEEMALAGRSGGFKLKTLVLVSSHGPSYAALAVPGKVALVGVPGWSYVEFALYIVSDWSGTSMPPV